MAEEKKEVKEEKTQDQILAELKVKLDKRTTEALKYEKENKELKDKQSELDKRLEQIELEKLSADEKAKFEIEKREAAILEKENLIKSKELELLKINLLDKNKISKTFLKFIGGNSESEVITAIEEFKNNLDNEIKTNIDQKIKDFQTKPLKNDNENKIDTTLSLTEQMKALKKK